MTVIYPGKPESLTTTSVAVGKVEIVESEPPLSPRARKLIIAIRRALLIIADELGTMAGLDARPK